MRRNQMNSLGNENTFLRKQLPRFFVVCAHCFGWVGGLSLLQLTTFKAHIFQFSMSAGC